MLASDRDFPVGPFRAAGDAANRWAAAEIAEVTARWPDRRRLARRARVLRRLFDRLALRLETIGRCDLAVALVAATYRRVGENRLEAVLLARRGALAGIGYDMAPWIAFYDKEVPC